MQWWSFNALIGLISLLATGIDSLISHGYCFLAKNCKSSDVEECGINKMGELKRFMSSCDMMKYNCDNYENYAVTSMGTCRKLPPLRLRSTLPTTPINPYVEGKKRWWCWEAAHCDVTNHVICGRDSRKVHRLFQSVCSMAKHNCRVGRDYELTNLSIKSCLKLIKYKLSEKLHKLVHEKLATTSTTSTSTTTTTTTTEESTYAVIDEQDTTTEEDPITEEKDTKTEEKDTKTEEKYTKYEEKDTKIDEQDEQDTTTEEDEDDTTTERYD